MTPSGPAKVTTDEIFSGKSVLLFGVTGAFAPVCHYHHLPGFLEEVETFKAYGVDVIACTAVNDVFVLDEWAKASHAEDKILFLADGNGDFARAMGLLADGRSMGFGLRSSRYAMWVVDGRIRELHTDPNPASVDFSGAAAMLQMFQSARKNSYNS